MEVFVVLFAAAVWDLLLGEPSSKVHPVVWMGKYIGAFWNRRPSGADDRKMLIFGGVLVVSGALLFSFPLLKSVFSISALINAGDSYQLTHTTGCSAWLKSPSTQQLGSVTLYFSFHAQPASVQYSFLP